MSHNRPGLLRRLASVTVAASLALVAATGITSASAQADVVVPVVTQNPAVTTPAADYIAAQWSADNAFLANGALADAILGLAAAETHQTEVLQMVERLKTQAAGYATSTAAAAKLALVAAVVGEDPRDFGGVDLIQLIHDGVAEDPTAGGFFGPALAVLGLARNGATVPRALIEEFLKTQGADGSFGYLDSFNNNAFVSDPDYSGVALAALTVIPDAPGVADAQATLLTWAQSSQSAAHWTSFSPANTAGLLGSSLDDAGVDVSATVAWLTSQQLADGGLPNVENGTTSDLYATIQGILLFAQAGYATVTFVPAVTTPPTPSLTPAPTPTATPTFTPTPASTATPTAAAPSASDPAASATPSASASGSPGQVSPPGLPDTGASDGLVTLALVALGAGSALAVATRRRP